MMRIAISQRVDVIASRSERVDALDQRWCHFLDACGMVPQPICNSPATCVAAVAESGVGGVLLTGGNDLVSLGGDAPERDATEDLLLGWCLDKRVPVVGVCRGMQVILQRFGFPLRRLSGHAGVEHEIFLEDRQVSVNSFHHWGCTEIADPLMRLAIARDGVIEAIRHVEMPIFGIMWHPERVGVPSALDRELFNRFYAASRCAQ
jgi:gamma-glutamyl-gamma-aminobutyrate hydrolase PuuD